MAGSCRCGTHRGRSTLDALGGIAVYAWGMDPEAGAGAAGPGGQTDPLLNYYARPMQEALAAKLCELSGLQSVFFCSTGLEANEGVEDRPQVPERPGHRASGDHLVYDKAFHGRSIATLSATSLNRRCRGFRAAGRGFVRLPLNDIDAVRRYAGNL